MVIMSKLLLAAVATGKKGPMAVPVALLRTVKRSSCFRISCGTQLRLGITSPKKWRVAFMPSAPGPSGGVGTDTKSTDRME